MAKISPALAAQFDKKRYGEIVQQVDNYSDTVDEVVESLVRKYAGPLDDLIDCIKEATQAGNEVSNEELDSYILALPLQLYYTSAAQESLGLKEDTARAIRQVVYNEARDKATGTIADKDAQAEQAVEQETLVTIAYARAYKKLKLRCEAAFELQTALKKVLSRRMDELQLVARSPESSIV